MRTILISGANRGIGKAIALQALADGHRLSLGIRNLGSVNGSNLDPKVSGNDRILLHQYDAANPQTAKDWVKASIERFDHFDSIIHCAGIFRKTGLLFKEIEAGDIDELWKVNILGPWWLTKEAWDEISKSNNGRIIVLVSMSGKRSKGNLAGYTTSKFGLMGLCQTIRNEGWNQGIRVTAICPGWVNTDMASNVNLVKKEEMTQPSDIGLICSNLLKLPNTCVPFEIAVNCMLEK